MIIQVTRSIFIDQFHSFRPEQFTYAGLNALFDYFDDCQPDTEFDVIEICCDFCQYNTVEDACAAYDLKDREELEHNTIVIDCADNSVIIANF